MLLIISFINLEHISRSRSANIISKIVAFNALQLSFCSLAPDHFDGGWLESVINGDRSTCFALSCCITFPLKLFYYLA